MKEIIDSSEYSVLHWTNYGGLGRDDCLLKKAKKDE